MEADDRSILDQAETFSQNMTQRWARLRQSVSAYQQGAGVRQGSKGDSDSPEEIDPEPEGSNASGSGWDVDDDNDTEEAPQLRRSTRSTRRTTWRFGSQDDDGVAMEVSEGGGADGDEEGDADGDGEPAKEMKSQQQQIEQVQQARMQGEAAWKAYFQDVRTNAQKKWDTPQQDPLWHWVECDACKKWRLVSDDCFVAGQFHLKEVSFVCAQDKDWPAPSCADPAHWVDNMAV